MMEEAPQAKIQADGVPAEGGVYMATTDSEKQAVYQFRYDVYVRGMNRLRTVADHEQRRFLEAEDATARQYYIVADGHIVATLRLSSGADAPFSSRQLRQYDLAPILNRVTTERLAIGERFMVRETYRGRDLLLEFMTPLLRYVNQQRIQLVVCDCEPFLLDRYLGLGFRPYTSNNVNSPEIGYLVPLALVVEDLDYLQSIQSPLCDILEDFDDDESSSTRKIIATDTTVLSEKLVSRGDYWKEIVPALEASGNDRITFFDDLSKPEIEKCLKRSTTIECRQGDYVVRKGTTARNLFVTLSGTLEVRDKNRLVNVLTTGDVFGEIAFLLGVQRSMDVRAATDDVRVLCLSESVLRSLIETDPAVAAKLVQNIAKVVSLRLLRKG
ncbi:MAG: cyclic nucleotide-binding domain-containing protein [Alphaproteobacteria bacterium]|nr:cyclic nucleotide-binding domain-containing protein [Alphaproteobacteria bacterium]